MVVGSLVDDTQSEGLGPNNEPDKTPPLWAPTVGAQTAPYFLGRFLTLDSVTIFSQVCQPKPDWRINSK
jgi:hypothetical protein